MYIHCYTQATLHGGANAIAVFLNWSIANHAQSNLFVFSSRTMRVIRCTVYGISAQQLVAAAFMPSQIPVDPVYCILYDALEEEPRDTGEYHTGHEET